MNTRTKQLALLATCGFFLVACGQNKDSEEKDPTTVVQTTQAQTTVAQTTTQTTTASPTLHKQTIPTPRKNKLYSKFLFQEALQL